MISSNLKRMRKLCKMTQEEVAEKIGVSRQAVAKWENGETVPDIYNCLALSKVFRISMDDLVSEADENMINMHSPKGKHIFGMVKVGERGQIVIPKRAREIFSICSGDTLLLLGDESQGMALVKSNQFLDFAQTILDSKNKKEE